MTGSPPSSPGSPNVEWGRLVHEKYNQVGFKLHQANQWTVIAGIILIRKDEEPVVVALGAGVKCLPTKSYANTPLHYQLVRDSHAEVLARRAFIAYLFSQVEAANRVATREESSILIAEDGTYKLAPDIKFGMYISQAPCGDASMHILEPFLESNAKRIKSITRGREEATLRGILRTKPGRRDAPPTLSLSCSDKIALWSTLGWQGAALSRLIPTPIIIDHFVIAERFKRGDILIGIIDKVKNVPLIFEEWKGESFEYSQDAVSKMIPPEQQSPSSVGQLWWEGGGKKGETIADGRRLGAAKPSNNNNNHHHNTLPGKCQSSLSTEALLLNIFPNENPTLAKQSSIEYQKLKAKLFSEGPFAGWPTSNEMMENFRLNLLKDQQTFI